MSEQRSGNHKLNKLIAGAIVLLVLTVLVAGMMLYQISRGPGQQFTSGNFNTSDLQDCTASFLDNFNGTFGYNYTTIWGHPPSVENGQLKLVSFNEPNKVNNTLIHGPERKGDYVMQVTVRGFQVVTPQAGKKYGVEIGSYSGVVPDTAQNNISLEYKDGQYSVSHYYSSSTENTPAANVINLGATFPKDILLKIKKAGTSYSGYYNIGSGDVLVGTVTATSRPSSGVSVGIFKPQFAVEGQPTAYLDDLSIYCPGGNPPTTPPTTPPSTQDTPMVMHRFWSTPKQTHFYTISEAEKNAIIANDPSWSYDGTAFKAYLKTDCGNGRSTVYRFWHEQNKRHFYTINESERDAVVNGNPNWKLEGSAYCAYKTHVAGSTPLYRFWSSAKLAHFYTISEAEKNNILANDKSWTLDGIAFYVMPKN